jgi:hypothetical protein
VTQKRLKNERTYPSRKAAHTAVRDMELASLYDLDKVNGRVRVTFRPKTLEDHALCENKGFTSIPPVVT